MISRAWNIYFSRTRAFLICHLWFLFHVAGCSEVGSCIEGEGEYGHLLEHRVKSNTKSVKSNTEHRFSRIFEPKLISWPKNGLIGLSCCCGWVPGNPVCHRCSCRTCSSLVGLEKAFVLDSGTHARNINHRTGPRSVRCFQTGLSFLYSRVS